MSEDLSHLSTVAVAPDIEVEALPAERANRNSVTKKRKKKTKNVKDTVRSATVTEEKTKSILKPSSPRKEEDFPEDYATWKSFLARQHDSDSGESDLGSAHSLSRRTRLAIKRPYRSIHPAENYVASLTPHLKNWLAEERAENWERHTVRQHFFTTQARYHLCVRSNCCAARSTFERLNHRLQKTQHRPYFYGLGFCFILVMAVLVHSAIFSYYCGFDMYQELIMSYGHDYHPVSSWHCLGNRTTHPMMSTDALKYVMDSSTP